MCHCGADEKTDHSSENQESSRSCFAVGRSLGSSFMILSKKVLSSGSNSLSLIMWLSLSNTVHNIGQVIESFESSFLSSKSPTMAPKDQMSVGDPHGSLRLASGLLKMEAPMSSPCFA
jgi:hypothetical protein